MSLEPRQGGEDARVRIAFGMIAVSFSDGSRHEYALERGSFDDHDTMTMRFDLDGDLIFVRAEDPLAFSAACHAAAVPPSGAKRKKRSNGSPPKAEGFRLPVLDLSDDVSVVDTDPAPEPKPKRGLMRRKRTQHVHEWRSSNIPGGMIRRVCTTCSVVSLDLRETADTLDAVESSDDPHRSQSAQSPA